MAQTKRKRRSKHRGNAAGTVEARGRTGRPPSPEVKKQQAKAKAKADRLSKAPTWASSFRRALLAAGFMFVFLMLTDHPKHGSAFAAALVFAILAMVLYVPAGYYLEVFLFRRRMSKQSAVK
jgi:cation transport ATPase